MNDYIKREDAIEMVLEPLSNMPADDVVEVIRCKDCEFWNKDETILGGICDEWSDFEDSIIRYTRGDDYCSYGKRKGE